MNYRKLGRTGLDVSEIGFGCWGIGGQWGMKEDDEAIAALRKGFDLGINFYDTALGYGNGHSEVLIGKALGDRRDKVVIASKIPPKTWRWPATPQDALADVFPEEWIVECTEKTLKSLNTDYLDLQQLHTWTEGYTQHDELFSAFDKLKRQGKVRHFGVSANDWDPYGTVGLAESGKVDVIQVIYNIFEQRPEERLFPAALASNVGIIVRVPFEEGLLTGAYPNGMKWPAGDWRAEWLTPERLAEGNRRVDALRPFLDDQTPTLAQLALKFCLAHPAVSTVIPGMRRVERLADNVAASGSAALSPETLNSLKEHKFVHGWTYPWS